MDAAGSESRAVSRAEMAELERRRQRARHAARVDVLRRQLQPPLAPLRRPQLLPRESAASDDRQEVPWRPSRCFRMPDISMPGALVSAAEVAFFRQHGFLIKRGLVGRRELAALDARAWEEIERIPRDHRRNRKDVVGGGRPNAVQRREPATWLDPQWGNCGRPPSEGFYEGRQPATHPLM